MRRDTRRLSREPCGKTVPTWDRYKAHGLSIGVLGPTRSVNQWVAEATLGFTKGAIGATEKALELEENLDQPQALGLNREAFWPVRRAPTNGALFWWTLGPTRMVCGLTKGALPTI